MIELEEKSKKLRVVIPISNLEELEGYKKGIMGILHTIEIDGSDQVLMEHLKSVYDLLSHLVPDRDFLLQYKELIAHKQGRFGKSIIS